jgi:hypothetical protein
MECIRKDDMSCDARERERCAISEGAVTLALMLYIQLLSQRLIKIIAINCGPRNELITHVHAGSSAHLTGYSEIFKDCICDVGAWF